MIEITEPDDICLVRPIERSNPGGILAIWVDVLLDADESFMSHEEIAVTLTHQFDLSDVHWNVASFALSTSSARSLIHQLEQAIRKREIIDHG
jgi:hypothetical protein